MAKVIKKELILEGLNCASCANKIEQKVLEIEGILSSSMNFLTKTLKLELGEVSDTPEFIEIVQKTVDSIESGVVVKEKKDPKHHEHHHGPHGDYDHNDEHGHIHHHDTGKGELVKIFLGGLFFATAYLFKSSRIVEFSLFFVAYIIVGGSVLLRAAKNITKGQIFDENFLMGIATVGAFAIGEFPEGVAVMLFYKVGEYIQGIAVNKSRKSISQLMNIRPDYANLQTTSGLMKVTPEEIKVGDIIVVKPGEKIPLDGVVVEGISTLDTSALTGESLPREVSVGNEVLSGAVNQRGVLTIEVTKEFGESTVSKILDLVQNASSKKAPTENFITKFARYYTPAVVGIAVLVAFIPPLIIPDATFNQWIYRSLIFLVISCPCALVISIPLGFFGGIGGASRKGILVKGSNYLEALNDVDVVVFDKTGTLTKGVFKVVEVAPFGGVTREELLEIAAFAESYSTHPIATSIVKEYAKEIDKQRITEYQEIAGQGVSVKIDEFSVLAGNATLIENAGIEFASIPLPGTVVHVAVKGKYAGYILIADEIKPDSKKAISALKSAGIKRIIMLTGDNLPIAQKVSEELGINEFYSELLPHQKVEEVESLINQLEGRSKLLFVGDGINDAPVLARADVGVAMGGVGSDAAIEAADVVIMNDEPSKIPAAIKVAKRTRAIVWQNIIFAIGVKLIVLGLGTLGLASIWEAVFADVGVTVIAVLNALRVLKIKEL